jgi:hypothetical protein
MWDLLNKAKGSVERFAGDRLNDIQNAYNQADESLDGWLPGGSKQSPVGRTYQQNRENPGYAVQEPKPQPRSTANPQAPAFDDSGSLTPQAQEMIEQYAPSGTSVTQDTPIPGSQLLGPRYEASSYAVPVANRINIGEDGNNMSVLAHEIGHLDGLRPSKAAGVLGRTLTESTEGLKDLPVVGPAIAPIRAAGGLIRAYGDAAEEEYAERFTRQLTGDGVTGFGDNDRSNYGADEYAAGISTLQDSLYQMSPGAAYLLDTPLDYIKPSSRRK